MIASTKGIVLSGGGGVSSDELSVTKEDVLEGKLYVGADTDDGIGVGTMPNNGAWSATLGANGTVIIPKGFHNGNGRVSWNIPTISGITITPGRSNQTVNCDKKIATGDIICKGDAKLNPANIRKGVTIFGVTGTWERYPSSISSRSLMSETFMSTTKKAGQWGAYDMWYGSIEYGALKFGIDRQTEGAYYSEEFIARTGLIDISDYRYLRWDNVLVSAKSGTSARQMIVTPFIGVSTNASVSSSAGLTALTRGESVSGAYNKVDKTYSIKSDLAALSGKYYIYFGAIIGNGIGGRYTNMYCAVSSKKASLSNS